MRDIFEIAKEAKNKRCYCGRKAKWVSQMTGEASCGYHYKPLPEPTYKLGELAGNKSLF